MWEAGCRSTSWSTKCCRATCGDPGSWFGAGATAGCGCEGIGRIESGWGYWSWWGEANAEFGMRNAECQRDCREANEVVVLFRTPHSALRIRVIGIMSITVVLDEPQDLVNIAHVVRAMKNFRFRDLRLVNPREYDAYRVGGIAHQTQDILARVQRFETLEAALADCIHVTGFTARGRSAKRNLQRPRAAAAEILERAARGPAALVFGREDKGLTNEALDRCHRVVTIPASPAYPSLNLAHAVVLMLYELALARGDEATPFKPPRRQAGPARVEDLERLCADVEQALRL